MEYILGYSIVPCANANESFNVDSIPYGNIKEPNNWGSGGGNSDLYQGGNGGGLIIINVVEELYSTGYFIFYIFSKSKCYSINLWIKRKIEADGTDGEGSAGGGSGGTITINATVLAGIGSISAVC